MALSKKKSRPITVDELGYRFQVSISKIDNDNNYQLNITAESDKGDGSVLVANGLLTRDFWADAPNLPPVESWNSTYPTVTPKHIANLIKKALESGWRADTPGPPFEFNINNVSLFGE
ncbi:MAG: hypothetical protein AB8B55_00360 [Mariniblastus sp.]